ncbi:MAG: ABC transporter ATP-binding protein [Patescibacteria group bacterium]|nr:ABC transporter ATP-binding protein [Patescibacteria group bacterium]
MIKLEGLTKKFLGKTAVNNLNVEINDGEVVGLLGPNGAGKTTTIRMMAGTLPPTSGSVKIFGQNISEDEEVKNQIGYLPENNPLYENQTVEEHLNFWAEIKKIPSASRREIIIKLIASLGLKEVYFQPIGQLSKGYKQRVGLSQSLLGDPKILLLDEPTEGLDPNQRREIHHLITGFGRERTVIICSHVLSEITKMCSRVIIINRGEIAADGSVGELAGKFSNLTTITLIAKGFAVKDSLLNLAGVRNVRQEKDAAGNEHFLIEAEGSNDLRPLIFELAKKDGWQLLELKTEQKSLEDVFAWVTSQ